MTTSGVRPRTRDARPPQHAPGDPAHAQFHAWAAAVRASLETIQALVDEGADEERALRHLLKSAHPDAGDVRTLAVVTRTRQLEIDRLLGALPRLDEE